MDKNNPTIIIADDENHMRLLIKKVLVKLGFHTIHEAHNGNEVIKLLETIKPDIFILDVNMPFETGLDVLKHINSKSLQACIIMLTSLTDMETVENCIDLGINNYIRKDTQVQQISSIIKQTWQEYCEERGL